jgi:Protein of unknown function (DUF2442)
MFPKIIEVNSLPNFHLSLKYEDGTKGIVDISHLANKGVFKQWDQNNLFSLVYIDKDSNAIAWNDELDICPDALYLKLKKMSFENWKAKEYATN